MSRKGSQRGCSDRWHEPTSCHHQRAQKSLIALPDMACDHPENFFVFVLRHNCQCSGVTSDFAFRNYSWKCFGGAEEVPGIEHRLPVCKANSLPSVLSLLASPPEILSEKICSSQSPLFLIVLGPHLSSSRVTLGSVLRNHSW